MSGRTSPQVDASDMPAAAPAQCPDAGEPVTCTRARLGPLWQWKPFAHSVRSRLVLGVLMALAVAGLAYARTLRPDPSGLGTHTQAGLEACGFLLRTGLPCPTCGMTTAFAWAVRGHWVRAFLTQPAGFVLFLGVLAFLAVGLVGLIGGRWPAINWYRVSPAAVALAAVGLLLIGWAFTIARVRLGW